MADFNQINQFGSAKPARSGEGMSCAECEAMLTDFIDGTLSEKDRAAFDRHIASCKECSQMLADAQRGAALLEMLRSPRPEPSASLLDRILAETSGQTAAKVSASTGLWSGVTTSIQSGVAGTMPSGGMELVNAAGPSEGMSVVDGAALRGVIAVPDAAGLPGLVQAGKVLPFRSAGAGRFSLRAMTQTMMQPRLAMTAAMAFFSIALTLNLTGVHLSELRASDLKPSNLKHTFYQADASLVRYYENLRVVYELESRLSDLKQASDSDYQPAKKSAGDGTGKDNPDGEKSDPQQKKAPKPGSGTSQRRDPMLPQFKLAAERRGLRPGSTAVAGEPEIAWIEGSKPGIQFGIANKSKEEMQEGGSV